jgi:holo-[acyl-carrier protein] synthase
VNEVLESIERFGDRYVRRLFTDDEIEYCRSRAPSLADQGMRFAARFAAKEATIKVLRTEARPDFRCIEVRRSKVGWCDVVLHGAARELADRAGISGLSLSMSHEPRYATAVVVARRSRVRSWGALVKRALTSRRLGR